MAGRPKGEASESRSIRLKASDWARIEDAAAESGLSVNAYLAAQLTAGAPHPRPAEHETSGNALLEKPLSIKLEAPHREALARIRKAFNAGSNNDAVRAMIDHTDSRLADLNSPLPPQPKLSTAVVRPAPGKMRPIAEIEADKKRRLALASLFAPKARGR